MVTNNNNQKRQQRLNGKAAVAIDAEDQLHDHHGHSGHKHLQLEPAKETVRNVNFVKPAGGHLIYMREGAFDIVWPNVIAYFFACVLHFYAIWLVFHPSNWSMTNAYSLMMCESLVRVSASHALRVMLAKLEE